MGSELEQKFYDTFSIEPRCHNPIVYLSGNKKCKGVCQNCEQYNYPNITAEKLLQMICIYNEFQNNCDYLVVPINIKTFKDDFLKIMIKSANDKYMNKYFCNDVNRYKTTIQQLFTGE